MSFAIQMPFFVVPDHALRLAVDCVNVRLIGHIDLRRHISAYDLLQGYRMIVIYSDLSVLKGLGIVEPEIKCLDYSWLTGRYDRNPRGLVFI